MMISRKNLLLVSLIILLIAFISLNREKTIKIAFVGTLSEHWSQLAIESRDGFMIAVDDINKNGGVLGKEIEVLYYDDRNDLDHAKSLKSKFKDDGVKLVSGFHISQMKEAVDYIMSNNDDILFVSPTMNSHTLLGIDDNLILMMSSANQQIPPIVEAMLSNHVDTLMILYDTTNYGFSVPFANSLKNYALEKNIDVLPLVEFNLEHEKNNKLLNHITNNNPDGIYFVANAIDTAELTQMIRNAGIKSLFFAPSWSDKSTLIEHAGNSLDNTYITGYFDKFNKSIEYITFEEKYIERYGYRPSYSSMYGYHSMLVLAEAMEKSRSTNPLKVKEAILDIGTFNGLQDSFSIDQYGDATGKIYLYRIDNGKFHYAK